MPTQISITLDLDRWELWFTLAAGLISAGLTLYVGRLWFRRQTQALPMPQTSPAEFDPFDYGSASNKRTSLRRQGNSVKVAVTDANKPHETYQGWVLDRSTGGLRLAVPREVPVGSTLSVRVNQDLPWVQVEVRRSERQEDYWELGCQFVRTPPWSVLLSFG
jgi:hypothetical protein